ncbi:MAG: S9 family peptidase, partial [Myxococcota bacterium]|nr:S9 family peptidase [Myxococcota bacterium]
MKRFHVAVSAGLTLLLVGCAAGPSSTVADPGANIRDDGPRHYDGVPEVPQRITDRLRQYVNTRSASVRGWSPDGSSLFITTRFGETSQLHRIDQAQGARHQLSFYDEPVRTVGAPPVAERPLLVGKDIGGNEAYQIYALDPSSGTTRLLTDGTSRSGGGLWSSNGDRFAYQTTQRNGKDWDIHVQLADGTDKALMTNEGYWAPLDWSDDDKVLLVLRYLSINESQVWMVDTSTGEKTQLNPRDEPVSYAGAVFGPGAREIYLVSDEDTEFRKLRRWTLDSGRQEALTGDISWDVSRLRLSPDGKTLAFTVNAGGVDVLYLLNLESGERQEVTAPARGRLGGLHFRPDSGALVVDLNSALGPGDAWVYDLASAQWTQWTTSEVGGLDRSRFVEPERITFNSFDQRKLPAFVYRPKGQEGPTPVVVLIHGGPESQFRPYFSPLTQYLVGELGIAVVAPNVRGSAGYGKSSLLLDNGMKREDSVKDIGALLDWIAADP